MSLIPTRSLAHARHQSTVQDLEAALLALADYSDQLAEQNDLPALGDGLANVRRLRQAVTDLERHVERHLADLMPSDVVNLDDDVVLERRKGSIRKKWQSEDLLRHLVGDRVVNPTTGENVFDTLIECVPFTASLSWRAGALRQRGIEVDDWCEATPGRVSVKVSVREEDQ